MHTHKIDLVKRLKRAMALYHRKFILILEILFLFTSVLAETYYITPTTNITCANENVTCLTLTEYAQQSLDTAPSSNITLTFAPGNHTLGSDSNLEVLNVTNLILHVEYPNSSSLAVAIVTCSNSGFIFENISAVSISGLEFNGCTKNTVRSVNNLRLQNCRFHTGHGIELERIKNATIERSSFASLTEKVTNLFRWGTSIVGGAIEARNSTVEMTECQFDGNVAIYGGSIYSEFCDVLKIEKCYFTNNTAKWHGGVINAHYSTIIVHSSTFIDNRALSGGAIEADFADVTIKESTFVNNTAYANGGVIDHDTTGGNITIHSSTFTGNTAGKHGGVIRLRTLVNNAIVISVIHDSVFSNNVAGFGGVINARNADIFMQNNAFISNRASSGPGGVINSDRSSITIRNSTFTSNTAFNHGGAIDGKNGNTAINNCSFISNRADLGGALSANVNTNISVKNTSFTKNEANSGGVLHASSGYVTISDCIFNKNRAHRQGGAMCISSSTLNSNGSLEITNNRAATGLVYALASTLSFFGNTTLSNNSCKSLYILMSHSNITFNGYTTILNNSHNYYNTAIQRDRAIDTNINVSDITFRGTVDLTYNQLYNEPKTSDLTSQEKVFIYMFTDYTIYIPTLHYAAPFSGGVCIYQGELNMEAGPNTTTSDNSIVNNGNHVYSITTSGQLHFSRSLSEQVHICFCRNGLVDCNNSPPQTIQVKRGQMFNISLIVMIGENKDTPLPSEIRALLSSHDSDLGEGQNIQQTSLTCKEFSYTISSSHNSEQLVLNANGPCSDTGISQAQINIEFLTCNCPIGFNVSSQLSNCLCNCDPRIYPEDVISCSIANESIQRRDNKWISYINTSDQQGYLIHPHCPFDYCRPSTEQVWINLNVPNGADAQCAFNRSGKLCGFCEDGLSLPLGSSHCMRCSNKWLALLIVFAVAGVALVAFILICNLTVAVGTINSLIFYANILTTNRATFFPFETPNFFTIFIAWLNLDFGFVTCFYDGMDGYAKEWLQLAFPLYIILMVAVVIIACEYSTRIALIFAKSNPVATLATLILISYTKSLRVIIAAFSSASLVYPDGSREMVWRIDANIHYLGGKHFPLFLVALLIVLFGIAYTVFLFSYQWLLRSSHNKALKWIRSARLYPFMDAYHAPYNINHRYWTGLLLFIRAFLYVAVACNVSGNPTVNLLFIIFTIGTLCLLKMLILNLIYRSRLLEALENTFIFNLFVFSIVTLYFRESGGNQAALAYASTSIAFITFLIILLYHAYAFVLPKKLRNKLDSIKRKAPTDEDNQNVIIPAQENQCTYTVVDPIPPPPKTLAELKERCKAKVKTDLEEEEANNNELKSPSLVSSKEISRNTAPTTGQNIEHQVNIELNEIPADQNGNNFKLKLNSATKNENKNSNVKIFFDPYIADIDQRGLEREAELNECSF